MQALYTHDEGGRIVRVRVAGGAPAPRFCIGWVADGSLVRRFREDVSGELLGRLEEASTNGDRGDSEEGAAREVARYSELLSAFGPVLGTDAGPAYHVPARLAVPFARPDDAVTEITAANVGVLDRWLSAWIPDVQLSPPLLALLVDGDAVSVCGSVRITAEAHEAGVDTATEFRGRGFAPRVVAAWARELRRRGVEALYSTSWQNTASRAVARKLGLVQIGSDLHVG